MDISKITLGTAQLGLNYGISNINGKPDFKTALNILKFSYENGINSFDTSPAYGNSEEILGSFLNSGIEKRIYEPIIITKLPSVNIKEKITYDLVYSYVKHQINQSIKSLKLKHIPIYLLHHAPDIFLKDGIIIESLEQLKSEGLIDKFGISAYHPEEIEASLNFKEIEVIEVPINIFDQRLIKTGLLSKLKRSNYIIIARSIYLQGLFFISPKNLPKYLESAKTHLKKLNNLAKTKNISISKIAFLFVRDLAEITSLIVGVENIEQIKGNLNFLKEKSLPRDLINEILTNFNDLPQQVYNPSLWEKLKYKNNT